MPAASFTSVGSSVVLQADTLLIDGFVGLGSQEGTTTQITEYAGSVHSGYAVFYLFIFLNFYSPIKKSVIATLF